jgi:poly(3-hydroxybutyrate) depolymerase
LTVFAVCQPAVPVLAAAALTEASGEAAVPRTLILAGGPVDTRIDLTAVNNFAKERGLEWFRLTVITEVPWPTPGCGRSVYPGFFQLSGFMLMNLDRHLKARRQMVAHLVRGDGDLARQHRKYYDEYLAVMDLTAEFYLQTLDIVFLRHLLPRDGMISRNCPVRLADIRRPALMTIEGEKDDITGAGQCRAALDNHFTCPDVGHFGIFHGSRFRE